MAKPKFVYVTYIKTTPEKLWRALIDPKFTVKYFFETRLESEWKTGAAWRLTVPDGRVADGGDNGATGDLGSDGHRKAAEAMDDAGGAVDGVKQPASRSIPAVDAGLPRSAEYRQAGRR